jgi:hypothetical protein
MHARKSLIWTFWLTSWLALLAPVLVSSIRTSGLSVTGSFRPDSVGPNFALSPVQPTTCVSAAMATDAVLQVNALPSENEETDRADALDKPRVSFLIPCSFRKVADRQSIVPRSILSHYPLRWCSFTDGPDDWPICRRSFMRHPGPRPGGWRAIAAADLAKHCLAGCRVLGSTSLVVALGVTRTPTSAIDRR